VYPELYDKKYLYDTHEESVIMVCDALQQQYQDQVELNCDPLATWFGQGE
jgi:gluconate kinase